LSTPVRTPLIVAAAGALACTLGAFLDPARAAVSYLAAYVAGLGVVLGALALVMIGHVTGATWFVVLRRRAEDVTATLPAFAAMFVPVLVSVRVLYPWAFSTDRTSPELRSAVLPKAAYLNVPFFGVRAAVYWGTWLLLAEALRRASLRQDDESPDALARRMYVVSAAGLPAFALTLTFAAFDWTMSLTPAWSSAIYGVYVFAGDVVGALALLALLAGWSARHGALRGTVSAEHFHALGKLLLTFVLFWAYVGYSQLLIVWIGDLPREIAWYVARSGDGWRAVAALLVVGHFAVPFLLLLVRAVKRSRVLLAALGAWLLAMHYVDAYWLVLPAYTPRTLRPHWLDLAGLALVTGVAAAVGGWRGRGEAPVPRGDPALAWSLRYRPE
jgi:hypothetical protein